MGAGTVVVTPLDSAFTTGWLDYDLSENGADRVVLCGWGAALSCLWGSAIWEKPISLSPLPTHAGSAPGFMRPSAPQHLCSAPSGCRGSHAALGSSLQIRACVFQRDVHLYLKATFLFLIGCFCINTGEIFFFNVPSIENKVSHQSKHLKHVTQLNDVQTFLFWRHKNASLFL